MEPAGVPRVGVRHQHMDTGPQITETPSQFRDLASEFCTLTASPASPRIQLQSFISARSDDERNDMSTVDSAMPPSASRGECWDRPCNAFLVLLAEMCESRAERGA